MINSKKYVNHTQICLNYKTVEFTASTLAPKLNKYINILVTNDNEKS